MSIEDQEKWNKKYTTKPSLLEYRDVSEHLKKSLKYAQVTQALDLACGTGRNSIYLAKNSIDVDALDISKVALDLLKKQSIDLKLSKHLNIEECDLDNYISIIDKYDLIIITNYLDRKLIDESKKSLKVGGIFFIETYMQSHLNEKKDSNQNYLLKSNELKEIFKVNFKVLSYKEFENEPHELYRMQKQAITVKKIK